MPKHDTSRLLEALVKQEKAAADTLKDYSKEASAAASSLNAWAVADSEVPDFMDVSMKVAALLMECADSQHTFIQALTSYRDSLKDVMEREKEIKVIMRDREILVGRVLRLSSKKPNDKRADAHSIKLDEASKELGACENALRNEEMALAGVKQRIFKEALSMRFRAQADLGKLWQDTASDALELLDGLSAEPVLSYYDRTLSPRLPASPNVGGTPPQALLNGDVDHLNERAIPSSVEPVTEPSRNNAGRPPTVQEEPDSSDEEAALKRQFVAHSNPSRSNNLRASQNTSAVSKHKRDNSSDLDTSTRGHKKEGSGSSGFFKSISNLFKPRDQLLVRDDGSDGGRFSSPAKKKGGGWSTRTDANISVQQKMAEKTAAKDTLKTSKFGNVTRARRDSNSSDDFRDTRKLTKVVNQTPPLWSDMGITTGTASVSGKKKSGGRVRSGSVTSPSPSLVVYQQPRRAASESGFSDSYEAPAFARPSAMKKPALSRSNSSASAAAAAKKRASAPPITSGTQHDQLWPQSAAGLGKLKYTPSLLSVMSDGSEAPAPTPTSRKYLTAPDRTLAATSPATYIPDADPVKRRKSTSSKASKTSRPVSMVSTLAPNKASTANDITVMTLPSAAAYKSGSVNDAMNTLVLPSAAGSRAQISGNTLTLPTAPPPVSSTNIDSRPLSPTTQRPSIVRQPSPIPLPNGISVNKPATQSRTNLVQPTSPIMRAVSPTPSAGKRKSVRIADSPNLGQTELPPPVHVMPAPEKSEKARGKERATVQQMDGWSRSRGDETSDEEEEDPDIAAYKAARKELSRPWDQPAAY